MRIFQYSLFLVFFTFFSCEEVVDVELTTSEPRLVIEASIQWINGTPGNEQSIKLTTTTDYFSNEIPPVTNAIVYITTSTNQVFTFIEDDMPGIYECNDFVPVLDESYTLVIIYEGETYMATEKLLNTPTVTRVEQKNDAGVLGDEIEVKFYFDDLVDETNQYLLRIDDPYKVIPEYEVVEDRFFVNNEMFGLYFSEDLKPNDVLKFTLNGITKNYFNYMDIILDQVFTEGPFSTPTSTSRGNVINQSNFDNYALGYFRLSKTEIVEYTIQ
jgi:Domain of unknown function (DUF4249)